MIRSSKSNRLVNILSYMLSLALKVMVRSCFMWTKKQHIFNCTVLACILVLFVQLFKNSTNKNLTKNTCDLLSS